MVTLADGRQLQGQVGDWLVTQGRLVIDVVAASRLTSRYEIVEARDRILPAALCARLEQTTGIGSTRSPEDLVNAVERLAAISIGTVHVDFTPGQLEEIRYRATKRGQTVQQALQAVVDRIREEIFWKS